MPIYEYKCENCDRCFECLVLSGEKQEEVVCPDCKGKDVKRLMSAAACIGFAGGKNCAPAGSGAGFS